MACCHTPGLCGPGTRAAFGGEEREEERRGEGKEEDLPADNWQLLEPLIHRQWTPRGCAAVLAFFTAAQAASAAAPTGVSAARRRPPRGSPPGVIFSDSRYLHARYVGQWGGPARRRRPGGERVTGIGRTIRFVLTCNFISSVFPSNAPDARLQHVARLGLAPHANVSETCAPKSTHYSSLFPFRVSNGLNQLYCISDATAAVNFSNRLAKIDIYMGDFEILN